MSKYSFELITLITSRQKGSNTHKKLYLITIFSNLSQLHKLRACMFSLKAQILPFCRGGVFTLLQSESAQPMSKSSFTQLLNQILNHQKLARVVFGGLFANF